MKNCTHFCFTDSAQKPAAITEKFIFFLCASLILAGSCSRPAHADPAVAGYVIAQEKCHKDTAQDSWLLDLTVYPGTPQLGDSLTIDNITYANVIKLSHLHPQLKIIGLRVSIEYTGITEKKASSDCDVQNPQVYLLRELLSTHQAEIR